MNSIVIKHTRGADGVDKARLVHRIHDMSGTDYEGIAEIDFGFAFEMGREGVVLKEADAARFSGRPGVVFCPCPSAGKSILDIRRNVADGGTSVRKLRVDADLEALVLANVPMDTVKWLRGEPRPAPAANEAAS